jgi:putative DNA primase/helicase
MAKTGGSGIPNDLARLKGARFVTASEAEVSDRFAESLIKQLTGGDKITARYLHKEFFEFVPCCKLWLATNYPPKIKGTDHAIWRRIHLIPFDVSIPEDEQDHQLLDKLMAELPGILSWAVAGCLEWQREGLNPPDRVTRATREYREDMDEYADFLSDALIATKGTKVPKRDMHDAFLSWSRAKGVESLSKREFGTLLKHAGYSEIRSKKTRYWNDVALSPEFEGTGYV